ncbi:unnamed protein product [Chondrus crispus]|uniref:H(+)-exporting diphosphatase n=1 Tax=Chondrus crispus TaxID=2769 RepID=R7QL36_CHOCR|nr:unnamed protein product [Chondrus crispus]CDF39232.1 unnamed protein product [Chondrus crispus]|eukprot:XP_005719143.1 unnamed protein product [Chondrus crispus]
MDNSDSSDPVPYSGYTPLTPSDFPFREDKQKHWDAENPVDPTFLVDKTTRSKSLLLCLVVFAIAFLILFVWQILVAKCVVSSLCEKNDASSGPTTDYLFQTFTFRVPSALLWIGLVVGALAFFMAARAVYTLLMIDVGPARLLETSMLLRKVASTVLLHQYAIMVLPTVFVFTLIGAFINWATASCFILGALMALAAGQAGVSIATRGQVRSAAQAVDDVKAPFKVSYRSGAAISSAVLGIAVLVPPALYLMISDVRALAGLAAGSTAASLFVRMANGILTRATNTSATNLCDNGDGVIENPQDAHLIAAYASSGLGAIVGTASDTFASIASAVAGTAILGTSLPFFYRNSLAMCVFNHLYVDQVCGPFGYPQRLSYATYICKEDNLYMKYPDLRTWGSNSAFVALPFVIVAIGILVSLVCTVYPLYGKYAVSYESQALCVVRGVRITMRRNYVIGYVLFIAASAALCFGLFGPLSEFQSYQGLGKVKVQRMVLDGSSGQCGEKYLNFSGGEEVNPVPVPQGGVLKMDHYRPMTVSGRSLGNANSTSWRLFGCLILGVLLAATMTGITCDHFTSATALPTAKVTAFVQSGNLSKAIIQAITNGLIATALQALLVAIALLSSYKLFGAYGTGLTTLGFLCSAGSRTTSTMMNHVAENSNNISCASRMRYWRRTFCEVLSLVSSTTTASNTEFANGASVLTACTLFLAVAHQSGLVPSPRGLVSPEESSSSPSPSVFIANSELLPVSDILVTVSAFLGVLLPFAVAGLLVAASAQATDEVAFESENYTHAEITAVAFFRRIARLMLLESVIPVTISLFAPVVIGFGFGQRALSGWLMALIPAGYILGTFLTSASSSWNSADRQVGADLTPSELLPCENARHMPRLLREGRGRFTSELTSALRDCAGPGLQSLSKFSASMSLVAATVMRPDDDKGWIGGIILAIIAVFLLVFALLKSRWWAQGVSRSARDEAQVRAPPKQVSPFYEEGPMIDPATVRPGSQVHDALLAIGSPTEPVSPTILPGVLEDPFTQRPDNFFRFMSSTDEVVV